jgi:hypothetical protein
MFEKCDNCGRRLVFEGRRKRDGLFCSRECEAFARRPGFCRYLLAETDDVSADPTISLNGCGTRL